MRVVADIPNPQCKITIMSWNQKYLIKLEHNGMEQTYKVAEFDVMGDDGIKKMITEEFIGSAMNIFITMLENINKSLHPEK